MLNFTDILLVIVALAVACGIYALYSFARTRSEEKKAAREPVSGEPGTVDIEFEEKE